MDILEEQWRRMTPAQRKKARTCSNCGKLRKMVAEYTQDYGGHIKRCGGQEWYERFEEKVDSFRDSVMDIDHSDYLQAARAAALEHNQKEPRG